MGHRFVAALITASVLTGCAATSTEGVKLAQGEKIKISRAAWSKYEDYVSRGAKLGPKKNGAFAVAMAGGYGVTGVGSWYYCPRDYDGCRTRGGQNPATEVLEACRTHDVDCVIFARNDTIQVPYEIAD